MNKKMYAVYEVTEVDNNDWLLVGVNEKRERVLSIASSEADACDHIEYYARRREEKLMKLDTKFDRVSCYKLEEFIIRSKDSVTSIRYVMKEFTLDKICEDGV